MIYIDILILAMIAIFILNRLRGVLGRRTGNENDSFKTLKVDSGDAVKESKPDVEMLSKNKNKKNKINYKNNDEINENLNFIKKHESDFDLETFLDGTKKAFEYILMSYSKNELEKLSELLDKDLFNAYSTEINQRKKKKLTLDIDIIELKEPVIKSVELVKTKDARIKIEFQSQQIQTTKNDDGEIVEGDVNQILNIKELWIFSKKLGNKSPIWKLVHIQES